MTKEEQDRMIDDQIAHICYQSAELAESSRNLSNFIHEHNLYSVQPYSEIRRAASMSKDVADAVNDHFGNVPRLQS